MSRFLQALTVALVTAGASGSAQVPAPVPAQPPATRPSVLPPGDRQLLMQQVSAALGVDCAYCHGQRGRGPAPMAGQPPRPLPLTAAGKPRMEVAREMFLMVADINATVQLAADKQAGEAARVQCATCHRGVAIPRQLSEILTRTAIQQGPEAVVLQFNELRAQYYGKQAYDFSEHGMADLAERLAKIRPAAAAALMEANALYYPNSSLTHLVLGIARAQAGEYQGAMASFRQALLLNPDNNNARGRLAQLEGIR